MARRSPKGSHVYAIGAVGTECVKIGKGSPAHRLSSCQTGCPLELLMWGAERFGTSDLAYAAEGTIHLALSKMGRHVRGEWFDARGGLSVVLGVLFSGPGRLSSPALSWRCEAWCLVKAGDANALAAHLGRFNEWQDAEAEREDYLRWCLRQMRPPLEETSGQAA